MKKVSAESNVMVTTFGGYRTYRNELAETEAERVETFRQEWEQIKNQIEALKQENKENYRKATLEY